MFCAPGLIFGGNEGVRVPFSCFALRDSFSAISRASGPDFVYSATGLVFGGNEGVESRFHVLHSRTRFRRYRGRRVLFSCFTLPDTFSGVTMASGPIFLFCAPVLLFGGTEGVGSIFHILRARTRLRRYRGCRVPFLRFVRSD
jgi:hypothetical protein